MEAFGLVCLYSLTSFDDIKSRHIRVIQILMFAILGIVFDVAYHPHSLLSILGGLMIGCMVYLFSVLSKEKIGKGDGLVIMVSGLYLGYKDTLLLLWVSSIIATIIGIIFMKKYGTEADKELPFIPCILAGYLLINVVKAVGGLVVCG